MAFRLHRWREKKTALKIIGGLEASSQRLAAFQDLRTSDPAQRSVIN